MSSMVSVIRWHWKIAKSFYFFFFFLIIFISSFGQIVSNSNKLSTQLPVYFQIFCLLESSADDKRIANVSAALKTRRARDRVRQEHVYTFWLPVWTMNLAIWSRYKWSLVIKSKNWILCQLQLRLVCQRWFDVRQNFLVAFLLTLFYCSP